MRRVWLVGGLLAGAVAGAVAVRRLSRNSYDSDEIDTGTGGGAFGERGAPAPAQQMSSATTRTNVTPEQLSMAARVGEAAEGIRQTWPLMTVEEIMSAGGDLDRLAGMIAQKSEQPREQIRAKLDDVIVREEPRPSYPAH